MDKYEYKVRSEEISKLIDEEKYAEAVNIADTIDWRRVKSITMLLKIAALYRVNRRNEDSRALLLLAYDRYPTNRSVVYSLCEVSIELDDVVAAIEYYKQFVKLAPRDNGVFTLRYRILEAQEASLEERIELLEELKKRDYQEEWAYELAYLYHRVGLATKCVEECDDMILWFGDGAYVMKAMELKMLHAPLTAVQQMKYDQMVNNSAEGGYSGESPDAETYSEENYQASDYAEGTDDTYSYSDDVYSQEEYSAYNSGDYSDEGYTNEGYSNESYSNESDSDESYTGEFYVEQTYDENGYPIESYPNENYAGEEYSDNEYADNGYTDEAYSGNAYNEEEAVSAPSVASVDMSQYNTINLQKVVAESMKELFPDEEDMFANEDLQEDLSEDEALVNSYTQTYVVNSQQKAEEAVPENAEPASYDSKDDIYEIETEGITDIPENTLAANEENEESEQEPSAYTGKVASMVTGVSETAPEPHTGAIKKVILPGSDARFIKEDTDIEALRDTTEQSVHAEQSRMEDNDENVYQEKHIFTAESEEPFQPITGQMKLDDVLAEWERMKLENAQRHQEEIKQRVLTQTGKIFADFDNSVKSGILGELEEDEPKAEKAPIDDSFLEADITSDIPQTDLEEEEAFEEEGYEEGYDLESEDYEVEPESISKIEEMVAKELGGRTAAMPQEEVAAIIASEEEAGVAEEAIEGIEEAAGYSDEEYYEMDEEYAEETDAELRTDAEIEEDAADEKRGLDPEDEEIIAEMAKEDALRTQEIKMNTADLSSLSDKILATTNKEAKGAKREEVRDFSPEEQKLFENFAVTKKIKKQIIFALEKMTLAAYTGNVIITGEAGLDTIRMAKNLVREFQATDANFSGKIAKITGEKLNAKNLKETFDKLGNGAIIIEKANGMTEEKLYEMAMLLNQETLGIIVIMEDTRKEISKLLKKQAMIADYFNIRIDLMEMDNNALVAYAKNYALALEYSIDELGTLALYTRIANIQSGNHVVTKDEVRDIIDEAIWRSKRSRIKNFVDVLFSKRYDSEDMIVLKERDFM